MARRAESHGEMCGPGSFQCVVGDLRTTRLPRTFDCVLALFHVMSYQTDDDSVLAAMQNAARHLEPGGVFVFDVWHAPAVLSQQPAVRVKRVADAECRVTRLAEPVLLSDQNCVEVDYTLFIEDQSTGQVSTCEERHKMRFFSIPEICAFARQSGFELLHSEEWLTRRPPGPDTWGVCHVLRRSADDDLT